jgi:hypothetical protein
VHAFIEQHPELKNELDLFAALKLAPDTSLVYEGKEELLKTIPSQGKRTVSLGSWWTYGAVAACLALAILLFHKPNTHNKPINTTIAHTTQQPETDTKTTAEEELHSTPKGSVAIENKQEQLSKAVAKTKKKEVIEDHKNVTELRPVIQIEHIAKTEEQPVTNTTVEPIKEEKAEDYAHISDPPTPAQQLPVVEDKTKQKLLAFAPVREKFEGIEDIREAVNEKVEKVKNITTRIKDTDIQFRFGNKELTVRL